MKALIKLHLKENRKKNTFILFGILGALLTLVVTGWVTFSTNTVGSASGDYSQYGFQWTFLTLMSAFGAVSLTMSTMEKHRQGNFSELLQVHGLAKNKQYLARAMGNVGISLIMGLVLSAGMVVSLIIKKPTFSPPGLVLALINYLGAGALMALVVSLLTLVLAPAAAGLVAILLTVLGAMRGILEVVVQNRGGFFGLLSQNLLKLVPPLSAWGQVSRDLFFGEFSDWNDLLANAFYLWALVGILYLVTLGVAQHES